MFYLGAKSSDVDRSETSSVHSSGGSGAGSGNELASDDSSPSISPLLGATLVPEQQTFEPITAPNYRYFVMKSSGPRQLDISQQKGIWATNTYNERRLERAFRVLVFVLIFDSVTFAVVKQLVMCYDKTVSNFYDSVVRGLL